VRDDFLIFGSPLILDEEIEELVATLKSGWIGTGPKTRQFEEDFRNYIGCKHAIGVNSCTAGLHLALDALGIREGDEVITTPMTFVATSNVVLHQRAVPVFVDIGLEDLCLDPNLIEAKITAKTKAILPVHFAGVPARMPQIMDVARKHGLKVVEDAAHAVETKIGDLKVGSIGDVASFSFYVNKNVVTAEGGMVTTNDDALAEHVRIQSLHGISRDAWKRYSSEGFQPYDAIYPGYKYNMTDIQASMGLHQLRRVEESLEKREHHWLRYNEAFSKIDEIKIPSEIPGIKHARHLYTILLDIDKLSISRFEFMDELKKLNIGSGIHYIALHLMKLYREQLGYKRGEFPNAEYVSDRTVSLPMSAKLSDQDVDDVIAAVTQVVLSHKKG
jgi:dTDP-4-amino-4,6-dideoxygalactose transaminase